MKKYFLILALTVLHLKLLAQVCNYEDYYKYYDFANKNYNDKNYQEAEKNIKLAFNQVDFPSGKGLYLALLVAQKQNNSKFAEEVSIKLAKGGVPIRFFRYLNRYEWYTKFVEDFESYTKFYQDNFKFELKEKVLDLAKRDKDFNQKYHDWRTRKIELTLEELIDEPSKILSDFIELTKFHGFPYEKIIGYNYVNQTDKIDNYNIEVLMIHIYQRGVLIFQDEINEIICNGGLHPNLKEILKKTKGFGKSKGIEEEMKERYKKYRGVE